MMDESRFEIPDEHIPTPYKDRYEIPGEFTETDALADSRVSVNYV